jgi:CheY-like chemotaxis protein
MTAPRVVAVINSNEDLVRIVREALEDDGYTVATAHIAHIKQGQEDLLRFLEQHEPDVVVWDLAPPYSENWTFLQTLRAIPQFGQRALVLTTVNAAALKAEVPDVKALELRGRRDDLGPLMVEVGAVFRRRRT